MTSEPHAEMHANHRQWLADLAMWQDDLTFWAKELLAAAVDFDGAGGALEDHRQALGCHGEQVCEEQVRVAEHERAIARYDCGEPVPKIVPLVKEHARVEASHLRLQDAHERLKEHHHTLMAKVTQLLKALAGPV